jgi:hypothetical protein
MLSLLEYQVLNACADDYEVFYFPFAFVNYGGQVFRRAGAPVYPRYEDEGPWVVSISAAEVLDALDTLIAAGFLHVWRLPPDDPEKREPVSELAYEDREAYGGYDCVTFEDHIERFDYGPHEFRATSEGIAELSRPEYGEYDQKLGWH